MPGNKENLPNSGRYRVKMYANGRYWMADLMVDQPYLPIRGKNPCCGYSCYTPFIVFIRVTR